MYHLVLPFNKKIVELKPVTLKDTLDFYHLGNDLKTIVKKLESFISKARKLGYPVKYSKPIGFKNARKKKK